MFGAALIVGWLFLAGAVGFVTWMVLRFSRPVLALTAPVGEPSRRSGGIGARVALIVGIAGWGLLALLLIFWQLVSAVEKSDATEHDFVGRWESGSSTSMVLRSDGTVTVDGFTLWNGDFDEGADPVDSDLTTVGSWRSFAESLSLTLKDTTGADHEVVMHLTSSIVFGERLEYLQGDPDAPWFEQWFSRGGAQ